MTIAGSPGAEIVVRELGEALPLFALKASKPRNAVRARNRYGFLVGRGWAGGRVGGGRDRRLDESGRGNSLGRSGREESLVGHGRGRSLAGRGRVALLLLRHIDLCLIDEERRW